MTHQRGVQTEHLHAAPRGDSLQGPEPEAAQRTVVTQDEWDINWIISK